MSQPLDPLREPARVEPVTAPLRIVRRRDKQDDQRRRREQEQQPDERDGEDDGFHIDVLA